MLAWVFGTGLFGVAPLLLGRWMALRHRGCECGQESSREDPAPALTPSSPVLASPAPAAASWVAQSTQ